MWRAIFPASESDYYYTTTWQLTRVGGIKTLDEVPVQGYGVQCNPQNRTRLAMFQLTERIMCPHPVLPFSTRKNAPAPTERIGCMQNTNKCKESGIRFVGKWIIMARPFLGSRKSQENFKFY